MGGFCDIISILLEDTHYSYLCVCEREREQVSVYECLNRVCVCVTVCLYTYHSGCASDQGDHQCITSHQYSNHHSSAGH